MTKAVFLKELRKTLSLQFTNTGASLQGHFILIGLPSRITQILCENHDWPITSLKFFIFPQQVKYLKHY